ncbi:protein disulfide-isomerase TMX3, partial [Biomphalaria glabrata]
LYLVMKELAFGEKDKFHSQFQFVWMPEVETVNSIAMSFMSAPVFMVLDTAEHIYYMPIAEENLTVSTMADFLTRVADGKEQPHGGTGVLMSIKRVFYDLISLVLSIWQASRWLFLLMFGLPTLIISFICYSLCCMEAIDDLPEDEGDEDDDMDTVYHATPSLLTPGQERLIPPYEGAQKVKSLEDKKKE